MSGFYQRVFAALPKFLRRRIHPLEHDIDCFVRSAARRTPPGAVALDAGAGESRFRGYFAGVSYIALDLGVGDSAWDYSGVHLLAGLEAIPLRDGSVDVVIHTQVLEHVPDPARVMAELHRVLKPAGRLYLTAPQGWHEHQQPHDYFRFTRFSLRRLLDAAGFEIEEIEPQGGYFHYLAHRLTYVPKVLFSEREGAARVLLFPLELASLAVFCFLLPLICHPLDRLDSKREFTLGYRCIAVKRDAPAASPP